MTNLAPFLVTGLALGAVYAISGVGLVVLYRVTNVLNFAYGAIGAFGAYISWELLNHAAGLPQVVSFLACVLFGGVATLAYGLVFGPLLADRDPVVKAMGTLGMMLILLGVMYWLYGDFTQQIFLPTTNWGFQLGSVRVNWTEIMALLFAIAVTAATALFLRLTKLGRAMRALADDREISAMLGLPLRRIEAVAWFGSGLICGATGLLLTQLVGLDAEGLTFIIISSIAAALIGRLRSVWVTLIAGIVLGVIESSLNAWSSISQYESLTPFLCAIIVLLWYGRYRVVDPRGSGVKTPRGRMRPGAASRRRIAGIDSAVVRQAAIALGLFVFVLLGVPQVVSTYWLQITTSTAIFAIVAGGLVILYGKVGLVSLCQIAIMALGGWVMMKFLYGTDLPFAVVLLLAGLITAVLGIVAGAPALRLSGLYLALVTLMIASSVTLVLTVTQFPNGQSSSFLGYGSGSAPVPVRRPSIAVSDTAYFRYTVIVAALMFLLLVAHVVSRPGRAWAAIRQSEAAARASGVNVTLYKLWAFGLAAFVAGVAGGLFASDVGVLSTQSFPVENSITLLAVVLMAGAYSLWGGILAGVLLELFPALLNNWGVNDNLLIIIFGVGIWQVLVTAPRGIVAQFPQDMARLARGMRGAVAKLRPARGPS